MEEDDRERGWANRSNTSNAEFRAAVEDIVVQIFYEMGMDAKNRDSRSKVRDLVDFMRRRFAKEDAHERGLDYACKMELRNGEIERALQIVGDFDKAKKEVFSEGRKSFVGIVVAVIAAAIGGVFTAIGSAWIAGKHG